MKKILFFVISFSFVLCCREVDKLKFLYNLSNSISIPFFEKRVKIDGKIEDLWAKSSGYTGFYSYQESESVITKGPIFYSFYNEESIYFLFLVPYPENRDLIADVKERDGQVFKDDSVEIFIVPKDNSIYQFIINSKGIIADLKDMDISWNGIIKATPFLLRKENIPGFLQIKNLDYWGIEIEIPFKNFGIGEPPEGEIWKVHFAVNSPIPYAVFSPCVKSFYEKENYVNIKFLEPKSPYIQITDFGDLSYGYLFLKGKIFNPTEQKLNFNVDVDLRKEGSYISEGAWQETVGIIESFTIPYVLNPGEEVNIFLEKDVSGKREINQFALRVSCKEKDEEYFVRKGKLKIIPLFNVNLKNFPSFKYIILQIDAKGVIEKYKKEGKEEDWVEFDNIEEAKKFGWKPIPLENPNIYIPKYVPSGKFGIGVKGWAGKYNCGIKLEKNFNYSYRKGDKIVFYLRGECHSSYGPGKGAIILIARFKDGKSIWRALYPFIDSPMDWKKFEIDMDLSILTEDAWKTWRKYNPKDEINNESWKGLVSLEFVSYYNYYEKDFIEIDGFRIERQDKIRGEIKVEIKNKNGEILYTKNFKDLLNNDEIKIDYKKFPEDEYVCYVSLNTEKEKLKTELKFRNLEKPLWWDTYDKYAKKEKVLKPWTPLKYGNKEVKCWGRIYKWDNGLLPSQIISLGDNILSDSIKIKGKINGKDIINIPLKNFKFIKKGDAKGVIITEGEIENIRFFCNIWIEFDGFLWITMNIKNPENKKIEVLKIEVPIESKYAKFYQGFHHEKSGLIKEDIKIPWMIDINNTIVNFYHWFGNEDKGIGFTYSTLKNWFPENYENFCSFLKERNIYLINLIEKTIDLPDLTYEFGIQATPVKPLPEDYHSMLGDSLLFNKWMYTWQNPENIDILVCWGDPMNKKLMIGLNNVTNFGEEILNGYIEYAHEKGIAITAPAVCPQKILYLMPPFEDYKEEWKKYPESILNWAGIPHYQNCAKAESYLRWYFNSWVENIKKYNFDGIYFDGWLGGTMACNNIYHGCGWIDKNGNVQVTVPVIEGREFHKALANFMEENINSPYIPPKTIGNRENFPKYHIWIHSWYFVPPIMGFGTIWVTGEFIGYPKKGPSTFTPEGTIGKQMDIGEFRVRGLSTHFGVPNLYHPCIWEAEENPKTDRQTRMILAWFMPHGIPIAFTHYLNHNTIKKVYGIRKEFGDRKSNFIPCWKENPFFDIVQPKQEEILIATWDKLPEKKVLAVISNLLVNKEIEIILKWKGFENPEVFNPLTNEKLRMENNIFKFKISPEDFILLEIKGD